MLYTKFKKFNKLKEKVISYFYVVKNRKTKYAQKKKPKNKKKSLHFELEYNIIFEKNNAIEFFHITHTHTHTAFHESLT